MISLLWIGTAGAADIEVTVYADEGYPPYSYSENSKAKGIYTEIVARVVSRMPGYHVTIKPVPWKRGLEMLENGSGFALYPPYYAVEKRPYLWPYSLPMVDEKVVVFCHEEVFSLSTRSHWPEDYYGLTVGNNAGFQIGGDAFWAAVNAGKIKVVEAKNNELNLLKLGLKRIDCYMNDRLSILKELNRLKRAGVYQEGTQHARLVEGATISVEQGFMGYTSVDHGKFAFKDDFVKKFNIELYEMRRRGELQRLIDDFVRQ